MKTQKTEMFFCFGLFYFLSQKTMETNHLYEKKPIKKQK